MDIFDVFQLVMLAAFLVVFLGRTVYLRLRFHIQPITLGKGKPGLQAIIEYGFFVGLAVWIIEVAAYTLKLDFRLFRAPFDTLLVDSTALKWIGVIMIAVGFTLFVLALVAFGRSWRVGIDKESPGSLVTSGIFSLLRNPIFVFIDLYFAGTFLINGTLIFLLFALLVVVGIHYQILQEEHFLETAYGDSYRAYRQRTQRYLLI